MLEHERAEGGGVEDVDGEAVGEAVVAVGAADDALDVAAVVGDGAFVVEVELAVVGDLGDGDLQGDRPDGGAPSREGGAGGEFEHEVVVGVGDAFMAEDDEA